MSHSAMKGSVISMALCLVISCQVLGAVAGCTAPQQVPPAIYMFGDGTLDVSNNNYLNYTDDWGEPNRANHSYYGIDFPNSEPTGRFSNGYNFADSIAKAMGLDISPPAYLSLTRPISVNGFTGVNYASEGARICNHSIFYADNDEVTIPLLMQIDYFADTRAEMEPKLGTHKLRKLLSKSLFLVSVGTKDLFHLSIFRSTPELSDNKVYVEQLVASLRASIVALYKAGARKLAIVNVPPIGCTPEARRKAVGRRHHRYGPGGGCDETLNELVVEFNGRLRRLLANLSSKLDGLHYSVGDFYGFSNATFANPSAAGFVNTSVACCKRPCDPRVFDASPCQNRTEYWFWDEEYTTEQAAKLAAAAFYDGPSHFTAPINFKKLVQRK